MDFTSVMAWVNNAPVTVAIVTILLISVVVNRVGVETIAGKSLQVPALACRVEKKSHLVYF